MVQTTRRVRENRRQAKARQVHLKLSGTKLFSDLWLPYLIVLLVIGGLTMLIYPDAAQWMSQYNYERMLHNYTTSIQEDKVIPNAKEQLAAARVYNNALIAGAQLLPNRRIPLGAGTFSTNGGKIVSGGRTWTYNQILNADGTGLMGRIQIPKIDVDLPIYHGTSDATLLKGAGHLEGTSFPIGGKGTRTVITAHRGLASAELFTRLNEVKKGDTFSFQVFGKVLLYRVINTRVIDPSNIAAIRAVPDQDLATLITCTPLGINTQRILVTGRRVIPLPHHAIKNLDIPKFPWFFVGYCLGVITVITWGVFQTRDAVRREREVMQSITTRDVLTRPLGSRGMHVSA